ncbi:alpha/beta hydrolase [Longimicrobium sp.]|uniref:alpha/beta hydrolase n=1 Tax=Longimicrobium sp. TaxID=2029185 RepID=UPI003B3AF86D
MHRFRFTRRLPAAAVAALAMAAAGAARPADALAAPLQAPAADSIDYARLNPHRGLGDCLADTAVDTICRVRKGWTAGELRARLDAGHALSRDGGELTFAYRGEARGVELGGGIQGPLSRLVGTDLWVLTVRVPRLDEAMVSYFFIPNTGGDPRGRRFVPQRWTGPLAPPLPDTSAALAGRIIRDSIRSRHLGAWRGVTVYVPPAVGTRPVAGVVFMGDGAAADAMGKAIDPLIAAGRLPRVLLVGMHADTVRGPRPEDDGRAAEYLTGFLDGDTRFLAHERFVVDEVLPWAEAAYDVPREAARRAVFGFSNSAAFALQMGLRHPGRFGRVLAFSPAGADAAVESATTPERAAAFYLLGGILEPAFHQKAVAWAEVFRPLGIRHVLREPVAGHDWAMWQTYFPDALAWAFGGEADGS